MTLCGCPCGCGLAKVFQRICIWRCRPNWTHIAQSGYDKHEHKLFQQLTEVCIHSIFLEQHWIFTPTLLSFNIPLDVWLETPHKYSSFPTCLRSWRESIGSRLLSLYCGISSRFLGWSWIKNIWSTSDIDNCFGLRLGQRRPRQTQAKAG